MFNRIKLTLSNGTSNLKQIGLTYLIVYGKDRIQSEDMSQQGCLVVDLTGQDQNIQYLESQKISGGSRSEQKVGGLGGSDNKRQSQLRFGTDNKDSKNIVTGLIKKQGQKSANPMLELFSAKKNIKDKYSSAKKGDRDSQVDNYRYIDNEEEQLNKAIQESLKDYELQQQKQKQKQNQREKNQFEMWNQQDSDSDHCNKQDQINSDQDEIVQAKMLSLKTYEKEKNKILGIKDHDEDAKLREMKQLQEGIRRSLQYQNENESGKIEFSKKRK